MTVCAMFGCKNHMHKGCGKHFFRFPLKDPERLARWIEAVQRDDWKPSIHSKVCSDHFTEKDYMIRPGAACPYLRTDAVPTPLFVQRKKKTKKRKYTKISASSTAGSKEGECEMEDSQMTDHQAEDMVAQDSAAPDKQMQEVPKHGQIPSEEPQSKETAADTQDKETGVEEPASSMGRTQEKDSSAEEQAAAMSRTEEKGTGAQIHGGEQTAETQSQEQTETRSSTTAEEPEKQVVETNGEQAASERVAQIDVNTTTQSERQVALILAELEDTHCEMRAAEARAAKEAASNSNQPPSDNTPDCAASSDNRSSNDSPADHIPFDHAYTPLTMSDKENNVPAPVPTLVSAPAPAPAPSPVSNSSKIVKLRKKIKSIQKQVLRQGVKIKSLKQTLVELRRKNLSDKDPERVISEHCSGLALALFTTQLINRRKHSAMQYYSPLKEFAISLHDASPKAYKFCRLFLSLPHPVSLRNWKTAIDGTQGALKEVVLQAEASRGEDAQAELSQEDILAGALQAVILENDAAEELQHEAPPGTQ